MKPSPRVLAAAAVVVFGVLATSVSAAAAVASTTHTTTTASPASIRSTASSNWAMTTWHGGNVVMGLLPHSSERVIEVRLGCVKQSQNTTCRVVIIEVRLHTAGGVATVTIVAQAAVVNEDINKYEPKGCLAPGGPSVTTSNFYKLVHTSGSAKLLATSPLPAVTTMTRGGRVVPFCRP